MVSIPSSSRRMDSSVVVAALGNQNGVLLDRIDQAMLFVDASGPKAGQVMLQGFGFSDPLKGGSLYILQEGITRFNEARSCACQNR